MSIQVVGYYNVPQEERDVMMSETPNPMCETFPRIAACNYIRFGSGGGEDKKNAICILGLNMINDKVGFNERVVSVQLCLLSA